MNQVPLHFLNRITYYTGITSLKYFIGFNQPVATLSVLATNDGR